MRKSQRSSLLAVTAALTVLTLSACGNDAPQGGAMPPPEVGVVTVTPTAVPVVNELPGRLEGVRTAEVRARVEGIVLSRNYREGGEVKAGQVMFKIDPAPYQAQLASAKASLARAEANAVAARQKAERYKPLVAVNAVSKQEYDEAVAAAGQAAAEIASAKAAVTTAQINLGYTTVTAPISGRAGRALVTEGALVGNGQATQLALVEQVDPIWVTFTQPATEVMRLRRAIESGAIKGVDGGAKVRLFLEDGTEYSETGKLLFSDMTVDPSTGAITLRAQFPNPRRDLLSGTYVRVRVEQGVDENALTVPQRGLIRSGQGASVLVVGADGNVAAVPVKVGPAIGDRWVVTEGLKGGEKVIVEGLQKVKPGAPAKAVPFQAQAPAGGASGAAAAGGQGGASAPAAASAAAAKQG
ncbi:efflux RND transporter periplasmic adaptor subunit [Cupriavidus gilardii]|uniref:Efflux RND transporter periplasmic adaptor subunit n=1 Tax=Cupriavidus gilardii TaxID=82541 RepID=A0A6N1BNN6_9BURK|nr:MULTISPECIES: efflux RND transporter periplasmic adaptor subunit [Cupriavidus]QQE06915.1 efflux RND transporter periplasmic adaptor subunit [Cupriavidus sp. ISTL7]KAB0595017.1 efflux RND transporter periplasmic adaptor subunit [Cupriavidus gilardii]MCD9123246.1 efflux RND transporter periplasmic adaptor subunit [Cupriavidus sp. UGS-1]MCT9013892.1 efflux RND transporter periplasmic adaptor subunit [Cupriavidus gilardii]MCT9052080.1 efflux RND transporter periplasmic adaptor subunit [Cupriavi